MNNSQLFWKTVGLRSKLTALSRRCSIEALEQAVAYLEANSIPAWVEPEIDWDNVEVASPENSNPERFVQKDILEAGVNKLRDKIARIERENKEKLERGEQLDMDD